MCGVWRSIALSVCLSLGDCVCGGSCVCVGVCVWCLAFHSTLCVFIVRCLCGGGVCVCVGVSV